MFAEIRNPAGFLQDPKLADMWEGSSADADMGLGFSCAPRKPSDAADAGMRAASSDPAARQNGIRPRNP